ncbi:serine hydrolase [Pelomonas sp. Root1237]|uniref:serine hydrolase domain-containing protein n=1 Tax=Pelomonas sp. Root1237 TaxID=1736434 RepID=UPI0006FAC8E2|nr:serine hydrolase domain-containing protein [Pelomonas sp. Root1237]KQV88297.1 hypothetical protein ASC91_15910 [Pelomonas sp. Root1237]
MKPVPSALALLMLLVAPLVANAADASRTPASVSPPLPQTAPGERLGTLLNVLNSGDAIALQALVADSFDAAERDRQFAAGQVQDLRRLHAMTGGLALRRVERSSAIGIEALAQGLATSAWYRLSVFTAAKPPEFSEPAPPHKIVALGIGSANAPPELAEAGLDGRHWRARLDGLIDFLAASDRFSGAVLVQGGGRTLYARAVGDADRDAHARNVLRTRFNLASITKMFTAVGVGQLVQAGKVRLSDPVGKLLPELADTELGRQVTVHHLLSHTSGMVGAREAIEKGLEPPRTARGVAEMTASFIGAPLASPPGQQFSYSNAGYVLLGAIIERVSGEPYRDYVQRHVFNAAGMRDSCFCSPTDGRHRVATAHEDAPSGGKAPSTARLPLIGSPANMAFATVGDMARFADALYRGRLLRRDLVEQFWTGVTEQPDGVEYGYGAHVERYNGRRVVWHGGGAPGATNRFEMFPDEDVTVVVLSNIDTEPELITSKLREWLSARRPAAPQTAPPPLLALSVQPVQAALAPGDEAAFDLVVANRGGPAHAVVVNFEVKDEAGNKVGQQFFADQKLDTLQTRTFRFTWAPKEKGRYRIGAGVFGPGWGSKLLVEDSLAVVQVP